MTCLARWPDSRACRVQSRSYESAPPRLVSTATGSSSPAFFFSSRRRHTRFKCDWSSDVCSSDLLHSLADVAPRKGVEHVLELVLTQIKDVLDAFARRDVGKAVQVWRSDEEVDAVNNSLFRELLT